MIEISLYIVENTQEKKNCNLYMNWVIYWNHFFLKPSYLLFCNIDWCYIEAIFFQTELSLLFHTIFSSIMWYYIETLFFKPSYLPYFILCLVDIKCYVETIFANQIIFPYFIHCFVVLSDAMLKPFFANQVYLWSPLFYTLCIKMMKR